MSIVYPLLLPSYTMTDTTFDLPNVDAVNALPDGGSFATELASPYWTASVSVRNSNNVEWGAWQAFFFNLRGQKKSFLMYDAARPTPVLYPNVIGMIRAGGGTFDGTLTISSFTDVRTVVVTGFPALFQMKAGDYLGFKQSGKYSLHIMSADAAADGSGHATLTIEPYINPDLFTTSASLTVYQVPGEFMLAPGQRPSAPRGLELKPITFQAQTKAY